MKTAARLRRRLLALMLVASGATYGLALIAPSSSGAAEPSGSPIVLGNVSSNTRAGKTDVALPETLQAWAKWTNAHGGINGRPVKVVTRDDTGDPAIAVSQVKELVEQDHVVAFLAESATDTAEAWASYVQEQKIPVLSGLNNSVSPWSTNPSFFPTGLTLANIGQALPMTAKLLGEKRFGAVLCTGLAACASAIPFFKAGAEAVGVTWAYSALAPQVSSDYTSFCLGAKEANAQSLTASGISVPTFVSNCARQGYHPRYVLAPYDVTNAGIKAIGPESGGAPSGAFPFFYKGPETKDFRSALKKYADVPTASQGVFQSVAWQAGEMFKRAVELSGTKGPPTSQDVFNGLYAFHNETLGGLTPPLNYSATDTMRQGKCFFLVAAKNGRYSAPNGLKPSCVPGS
jgi:branched-chain amino acid transport system substrate-binding protein